MRNNKEISTSKSEAKDRKFYNSPLVVAFVGFIFTVIVGGILTHNWQKMEYDYKTKLEQESARIRARSEAWGNLYNKIFNQTSEYTVAVSRIISMYEYTIVNPEQQREIIKNFSLVSNKFQKESVIIRSQLRLLFFRKESQEIISKIENGWTELINESELLNRHIADLVTKYRVRDKSSELTQKFNECQKLSLEFTEKVYNFGKNLTSIIFSE